jgi:hypothetical protein
MTPPVRPITLLSSTLARLVTLLYAVAKFSYWGGTQLSNSNGQYGSYQVEVNQNVMPSRYYHGAAIDSGGDLW